MVTKFAISKAISDSYDLVNDLQIRRHISGSSFRELTAGRQLLGLPAAAGARGRLHRPRVADVLDDGARQTPAHPRAHIALGVVAGLGDRLLTHG